MKELLLEIILRFVPQSSQKCHLYSKRKLPREHAVCDGRGLHFGFDLYLLNSSLLVRTPLGVKRSLIDVDNDKYLNGFDISSVPLNCLVDV